MNTIKNKIIYLLSIHTLISALVLILVVIYWLLYPYQPITYRAKPYEILNENNQVKRGEALVYLSDSCRNFIGEVSVNRTLVDHSLIAFPETKFYQDKKECSVFENRSIVIPSYAPLGEYHLEITSIVKVNPIRTMAFKVETEKFMVVE